MPDEKGKLSEQEYAVAQKWIDAHAASICSCGSNSWMLAQHVLMLQAETQNFLQEHSYYPSLLIICEKCGQFRLFGARRAGIKSFKESKSTKETQNAD